ncbi:unnamed protein product [Rotaria socialis]|uniref:Uncharacterized protein n=2 Tax=Rotaria socialis TaxID=392032 RepID=A0A818NV92_9BILA|nr:unnamed protein product [Rotaria socialis]
MFQNETLSFCSGLNFSSFISIIIVDQHDSSSAENTHTYGHKHPTHGKKYNRKTHPKTPGSQNAISTIHDAPTHGDIARKSRKFQVNTDADNPTPSNGIPQPTVPKSIEDYLLGGQGVSRVSLYDCNSNPKNRVSGYCILTIPDAVTLCNSDPNCGGFDITTNVDWHNAYDVNGQTVVQLFAVGTATVPSTEWSFYIKPQPTVPKSIGNYASGGDGIIHVASYNCNSNPKNVVSGYCVLTIPDALTQCNSDPNCGGIEVTTNVGWHNAYDVNGQTVVQLFAVGSATNPNAEWNYFNKNQETVVESIEDDAC